MFAPSYQSLTGLWSRKRATDSFFGALLVAVCFLCDSRLACAQAKITREDIAKAWKARQERVRTARFEWVEERTTPRGALTPIYARFPAQALPAGIQHGDTIPLEDSTYEDRVAVVFDGEKIRYTHEWHDWSGQRKRFELCPSITVYDGATSKTLAVRGSPSAPNPQLGETRGFSRSQDWSALPIFMTFRPLQSIAREIHLEAFTLVQEQPRLGDERDVELVRRRGEHITRVWLDGSRGFVITRVVTMIGEKPGTTLETKYRRGPENLWVPDRWQYDTWYRDNLLHSVKVRLASFEINAPVGASEFTLSPAAGTRLIVAKPPGKAPEHYIIKPDGSKRPVSTKELDLTAEQLMNSEPEDAAGLQWRTILAPAIVAVVALALLIWRRKHVYRRPSAPPR